MTSPLAIPTDLAGIERFAYQLFSRAADEPPRPFGVAQGEPAGPAARLQAAALDPARLQRDFEKQSESPEEVLGTRSSIPLAYRLWLAHLLWLEAVLHTLDCRPADLTAAELAGLQAVARARARFLRTHEFCPHCDAVNPRWTGASGPASRCRHCHQEL